MTVLYQFRTPDSVPPREIKGLGPDCPAWGRCPDFSRSSPGRLRSVSKRVAGWGPKRRYYNPPAVLVLDIPGGVPGAVRVAQVFDDFRLAGPGDFDLGNGFFAESWNTYTLRETDLEGDHGAVPQSLLERVLDAASQEWTPVEEGTPLAAFRRLEVEVGAYFALQAVEGLLGDEEETPLDRLPTLFPDSGSVRAHLSEKYPRLRLPPGGMDVTRLLAEARFPEEELPLAAADDRRLLPVNIAELVGGEIHLQPTVCEIRVWSREGEGLLIGGKFLGQLPAEVDLFADWSVEGGPERSADEIFIDSPTGVFRLFFREMSDTERESGRLLLLVVGC